MTLVARLASALALVLHLAPACDRAPPEPGEDAGTPSPAGADDACDGVDDDGDGRVDEAFVGEETHCGVGQCTATGHLVCVRGAVADDCLPDDPLYPDDNRDGFDDDCDGRVDEGVVPGAGEAW